MFIKYRFSQIVVLHGERQSGKSRLYDLVANFFDPVISLQGGSRDAFFWENVLQYSGSNFNAPKLAQFIGNRE